MSKVELKNDIFSQIDRLVELDNPVVRQEIVHQLKSTMGKLLLEVSRVKSQNISLLEQKLAKQHSEDSPATEE